MHFAINRTFFAPSKPSIINSLGEIRGFRRAHERVFELVQVAPDDGNETGRVPSSLE